MLKLVVLTQEPMTEAAPVHSATMVPDSALTLYALGVRQGAGTRVCGETLPAVTYPRLTEVTHGTHQGKTCGVNTCMFHQTISCLGHTFHLTTVAANWQSLNVSTKVAEGTILLTPFALITFH